MRLIDADELKKDIHKEWDEVRVWDESGAATADQFEILVDSAPIIEERKKGKWIGKPIAGYTTVRCSVCNNVFSENNGRWNFCPHCGADMRGGYIK